MNVILLAVPVVGVNVATIAGEVITLEGQVKLIVRVPLPLKGSTEIETVVLPPAVTMAVPEPKPICVGVESALKA